ncbi:MAG: YraN family protein [Wenzhouxiangella sp.]
MTTLRGQLGQAGERDAETFLLKHKLRLVERNYSCRSGEIDLVMVDPNAHDAEVLTFVEVRLRGAGARTSGLESIDQGKQRRLITAARHYLMDHPEWAAHPCRFDVIALAPETDQLVWVKSAFEAS